MPRALYPVGGVLSPDGASVAFVKTMRGPRHLVCVQAVDEDTTRRRVVRTLKGRRVRSLAWSPDGLTLAVCVDSEATGLPGVMLVSANGAEMRALGPAGVACAMGASPYSEDGAYFVSVRWERRPDLGDVVVHRPADGARRRVLCPDGMTLMPGAISPDGRWLVVGMEVAERRRGCGLVDLRATDELIVREVIPPDAFTVAGGWIPASLGFRVLTNRGKPHQLVGTYRLDTRQVALAERASGWDVGAWVEGGGTTAHTVRVAGSDVLTVKRHGRWVRVPGLAEGVVEALDVTRDGARVCVTVSSVTVPARIALVRVSDGSTRYVTGHGIASDAGVEPTAVRFEGVAGSPVHGLLYRPRGDGPVPVVLWLHDRVREQARARYGVGLFQWLTARGVGVLAVDPFGSTGHGRRWEGDGVSEWGDRDLGDLERAAEWLRRQERVRQGGVAVCGEGRHGAFAALCCVARVPEACWAAGVALGPVCDVAGVPAWSPMRDAGRVLAPLMIVGDGGETRVERAELDRFVATVRGSGTEVMYERDAEWAVHDWDLDHEERRLSRIGEFLMRHLIGGRSAR